MYYFLQAAQVTVECIIDQVYHRNIMGAKGSNVQAITQEHNVGIKFPERSPPQGAHPGEQTIMNGSGEGEETIKEISPDPRNIIVITGRMENVEAAKQALLVRFYDYFLIWRYLNNAPMFN